MKITHIVPGLDDPTCGIAVAAKMVARRQSALGKNVECIDFREWTRQQIADAEEVWVHSMWTPGVMRAAWTALRLRKKLVRMPHGCMDPVKRRHRWWKKMWVTPIERWLFARSDMVVATCLDEVEWVQKFEAKIKNVELLSLGDGASDKPLEDVHNPLRLLFVGRLHPLKGVEFLLEAMRCFLTQGCRGAEPQSLELRVIGKDEGEGDKLRQMATEYGLNVEFCGVVSEEEKEKEWEWCDVLVLPTLSENFGLVVAEALERGKRVITTDGAPAWGSGELKVESGECLAAKDAKGAKRDVGRIDRVEGGVFSDYGGRLLYLKGYRDGTREIKVELLKKGIEIFARQGE